MNKGLRIILLLLTLAILSPHLSAQNLDAKIRMQQGKPANPWAGEQATVELDLMTNGQSFSGVFFNLPTVDGAYLLRTDSSTIKLSENINGETWQILRYPIALFPQADGELVVPAFEVRFSASQGFGGPAKSFELNTEPLSIAVRWPPGATPGSLVVTTRDFDLTHHWSVPAAPLRPGAAITLEVERTALNISGMLLPNLPVAEVEGLRSYPDPPGINDKSDRGRMTGTRSDRIVWVAEAPGQYALPAIRFNWFNPQSEELQSALVPGLSLDIEAPLPGASAGNDDRVAGHAPWTWLLRALVIAGLLSLAYARYGAGVRKAMESRREARQNSAQWALQKALKACANNDRSAAYRWSTEWVQRSSDLTSLSAFARQQPGPHWQTAIDQLQISVMHPQQTWNGAALGQCLRAQHRSHRYRNDTPSAALLPSMNPTSTP